MSAGALIMMLVFMAVLWGGFGCALSVAMRREASKSGQSDEDEEAA